MSNEQFKKDLLVQRGMFKIKIKQLTMIEQATGIKRTKEIDALLDKINIIDKVLKELNKK